jgi:hypothetical protein
MTVVETICITDRFNLSDFVYVRKICSSALALPTIKGLLRVKLFCGLPQNETLEISSQQMDSETKRKLLVLLVQYST